jgi:lactoylglutathione lyase
MKQLLAAAGLLIFFQVLSIQGRAQSSGTKPAVVVNHLAWHVTNLQASTQFYLKIVGLDTIPEPFHDGKHTWFSMGNGSHLHLIEAPGTPLIPGKSTHLCFSVKDVNAFVAVLKANKVSWEDWPGTPFAITTRVDGVHQVYLKDPDGYWLEINDATH